MRRKTKIILSALVFASTPFLAKAGYAISQKGFAHFITYAPHIPISCPALATRAYLILGQSQAANSGQIRHIPQHLSHVFKDGTCYALRDPIVGATNKGGSIWPAFSDALGGNIVMTNMAITGSSIKDWTKPKQIQKVKAALTKMRQQGWEPKIIWMQGEADAYFKMNPDEYEKNLRQVVALAPSSQWVITRESKCLDLQTVNVGMNLARDHVAADFPNVSIGLDLDAFPITMRQDDHCHFTSEAQRQIGTALTKNPILR